MEERTIKRSRAKLTPGQRRIWLELPPDLQQMFLEDLPPLTVEKDNQRARKQRTINARIKLLEQIVAACQAEIRQLNIAWGKLEQGQSVDLREHLKPLQVEGVSIRFPRGADE